LFIGVRAAQVGARALVRFSVNCTQQDLTVRAVYPHHQPSKTLTLFKNGLVQVQHNGLLVLLI
jgi:hypothetical protein